MAGRTHRWRHQHFGQDAACLGDCLILSSAFHTASVSVFRVGLIWTELEITSSFVCSSGAKDLIRIFKTVGVLLLPVAALMLIERLTGTNYFAWAVCMRRTHFARDTFERKVRLPTPFWPGPLERCLCRWRFFYGKQTANSPCSAWLRPGRYCFPAGRAAL